MRNVWLVALALLAAPAFADDRPPSTPPPNAARDSNETGDEDDTVPTTVRSASIPARTFVRRSDPTGKVMVQIPAGTFVMGNNSGPEQDERGEHEVTISQPFWMDQYEVTRAEFAACVKAGVCVYPRRERTRPVVPVGVTQKDNWGLKYCGQEMPYGPTEHPLTCVNYDEARFYCEVWRGGRLPTEAEWERAARGGAEQKLFPWGNDPPSKKLALFGQFYGTKPVGSYPPNAFGLYDVVGNVWEWTSDWYDPVYPRSPQVDPIGPCPSEDARCPGYPHRTMRGGSWITGSLGMRNTYRNHHKHWNRFSVVGVRCTRSLEATELEPAAAPK
jgi:formylglycine-generating enzyme required for sulfatase activity